VEEATKERSEDQGALLGRIGSLSDKLFGLALDEAPDGEEAVSALCVASGRAAGLGGAEMGDAVMAFCRAFELGAKERQEELADENYDLLPPVGAGS
jgi:hypothetical protein